MARIVITEFMDERAVAQLRARHEVLYEPLLVDDAPRLLAEAALAARRSRFRGGWLGRGAVLAELVAR